MNISLEQKGLNKPALITTLVVHALLILLFLLIKYAPPVQLQPVEELGIEVNLGTDFDGSGTDQPMSVEAPAPEADGSINASSAAQAIEAAKSMMHTTDADAPEVRSQPTTSGRAIRPENKNTSRNTHTVTSNNRTSQTTNNRSANTTQPTPRTAKYSYPGGTGSGGNSATENRDGSGEGDGTGNGDKGVPGGTPGAKNYSGIPGSGNVGIGHSLSDRRIVAFPDKEAEFRDGGTVVIRVTVNREGRIVAKQVKSTTGAALTKLALRKAEQIRFDKNMDAPVEQFGTITFVFKTRS